MFGRNRITFGGPERCLVAAGSVGDDVSTPDREQRDVLASTDDVYRKIHH